MVDIEQIKKAYVAFEDVAVINSKFEEIYAVLPATDFKVEDFYKDLKFETEDDKYNFMFAFNCINFCYWKDNSTDEWSTKLSKFKGSRALRDALYSLYIQNTNTFTYSYLVNLTEEFFLDKIDNFQSLQFWQQRINILKSEFYTLSQNYSGSFYSLIVKNKFDAIQSVEDIANTFSSFADFVIINGRRYDFYKRAQLLLSSVMISSEDKFTNTDKMTGFSDYKLPQMLRKFGVLEYSTLLKEKINDHQIIEKGSWLEFQIRASTVLAIELLKDYINLTRNHQKVQSWMIDNILWNISIKKEQKEPYHLTPSIYY